MKILRNTLEFMMLRQAVSKTMRHVAQKMSHVVSKNAPCGIKKRAKWCKNRAVWHLPFSYKRCYNFSLIRVLR